MIQMDSYIQYAPHIWLVIAAFCFALEAFGANGIGFLFAGLGAVSGAIAIHLGMSDTLWGDVAWFFGATALWALILWIPVKRWRTVRSAEPRDFTNMIGDEAVVLAPGLEPGKQGQVRWSGTIMSARLAEETPTPLPPESVVVIAQVRGNLLLVKPQV